ncbi:MAG: amidohydrolase family protein [Cohnella sp.]|nr:amidohydrolase family protein [Cohnella sp.]
MIIDAHNHPHYLGFDTGKILDNMKRYRIDKTWLLTLETPRDEYSPYYHRVTMGDPDAPIPLSSCVACMREAPDRFILGYAPDARRPDSIDRLDAAIELYGVRVYGEVMLRMTYDNPDAIRMFRHCGDKGLPVIVEVTYGFDVAGCGPRSEYWYGGSIEAFERAVQACPQTTFLGHGPGFWAHLSGDDLFSRAAYPSGPIVPGGKVVEMMRAYDNLYLDLSAGSGQNALKRDLGFTKEFLLEFQDRALYGRDQFDNGLQDLLNGLGLDEEVLAKIYAHNANKLVPC